MKLVAAMGAMGEGGAVFMPGSTGATAAALQSNPALMGGKCILVGDQAMCPEDSQMSTVLDSGASLILTVGGLKVALVGCQTSCGHPLVTAGTNTFMTSD